MPVYDYKCTDCGNTYDIYHKTREVVADVVCPSCGSAQHKKLMSVTTVSMSTGSSSESHSCGEGGGCCGGACGLN